MRVKMSKNLSYLMNILNWNCILNIGVGHDKYLEKCVQSLSNTKSWQTFTGAYKKETCKLKWIMINDIVIVLLFQHCFALFRTVSHCFDAVSHCFALFRIVSTLIRTVSHCFTMFRPWFTLFRIVSTLGENRKSR